MKLSITQVETPELAAKIRVYWRTSSKNYYEKNKEELQKKKLAYYYKNKEKIQKQIKLKKEKQNLGNIEEKEEKKEN